MSGSLDISYLMEVANDPRTPVREDLATQVADFVSDDKSHPEDRAALTPVLLRLANDTVCAVRSRLARSLAHSAHAPREVLRVLVCDVDEICLPLLQTTQAMPESDLAAVAKAGPAVRQLAIARRKHIGPKLARIIVEMSSPVVCVRLLRNPGCRFDKTTFERIMARHGNDAAVVEAMSRRTDLPVHVAAEMVNSVSARLAVNADGIGLVHGERVQEAVTDQREKAIIELAAEASAEALEDLIAQLFRSRILTTSLILRAAFVGNMDFVAGSLAHLSDVPLGRVLSLLHGSARLGARAIYLRAGLPTDGYRAFRMALDVFRSVREGGGTAAPGEFGRRMIERVVTGYDEYSPAEQKVLLELLVRLGTPETRRLAAQLTGRLRMLAAA